MEDAGSDAFAFNQQTEQDVFGADVGMIERLGLFGRQREDFLDARCVRNVADLFRFRAEADSFFDFHADDFEIDPHLLQSIDGGFLVELDKTRTL